MHRKHGLLAFGLFEAALVKVFAFVSASTKEEGAVAKPAVRDGEAIEDANAVPV